MKRQSHRKSRNGCSNCKLRHVKCDEQGPPCANCVVRKTRDTCNVGPRAGHDRSPAQSGPTGTNDASPRSTSASDISEKQSGHPGRLLELELMNRWTAQTYLSVSALPSDRRYHQSIIPTDALTHEYLLNGILCAAALDIAVKLQEKHERDQRQRQRQRQPRQAENSPSDHDASFSSSSSSSSSSSTTGNGTSITPSAVPYIRAALAYYDLGSHAFRLALASPITPDSLHRIYSFSVILTCVNLVLPRLSAQWSADARQETMVRRSVTCFDLLEHTTQLVQGHPDWLLGSPLGATVAEMFRIMQQPLDGGLDADTERALGNLEEIVDVELLDGNAGGAAGKGRSPSPSVDGAMEVAGDRETYVRAVAQLRSCFVEDARAEIWGFCSAWPGLSGRQYGLALRGGCPLALLILMFWGVLLDRCGRAPQGWWAREAGRSLVEEVSESLAQMCGDRKGWREGIVWARGQLSLPI